MPDSASAHIESKLGVCGGKPCVAGTRIRVQDIRAWHELQGQTPEEIVTQFPQLSLADVYAALTYYYDHRDEIQRQIKEGDDLVAALRSSSSTPLSEKLSGS